MIEQICILSKIKKGQSNPNQQKWGPQKLDSFFFLKNQEVNIVAF